MKKSYMARFSQSFASLAQAGVPVLEVFQTVRGVVGNALYEIEIDKIAKDVANGVKVSVAIRKSRHFPAMVGQLVAVGEQSGDLAGIFKVLGAFFEKEVDGMAKNLSTLLEPIIMIVMGVVIGFILVSVLQPIYGLVNTV
jgi:type IV pilus assembly protein PilC